MNRYETGTYLTLLFDKHGTKQAIKKHENLLAARDYAVQAISLPPYASYVITRTISNSQDRADPWGCREEAET